MYAVIEVGGKQFTVAESDLIKVPLMSAEVDTTVEIDRVLLISNDGNVIVGDPTISSAKVTATVVGGGKHRKVTVFKKKRRKGYRVRRGHRQDFTTLKIQQVLA